MRLSLLFLGIFLAAAWSSPLPERLRNRVPDANSPIPTHRLKYLPRKKVPALAELPIGHPSYKIDDNWRIPEDIKPISYTVRLLPFIEVGNFTTDGFVEMVVECVQSTSNITFHSNDITLDYSSISVVRNDTGEEVKFVDVVEDAAYQKVIIITEQPLAVGSVYKISIRFVSIINNSLQGFYRATYVDNGARKWFAVTQFEESDARRAFPCFDEPKMKAVFHIILGRKESMVSISNMPIQQTIPIEGLAGYVWDIYEPSVKMSTYLVAFIVCEFDFLESDAALSNVRFRAWVRPEFKNQLQYAADVGPKIIEFFESYFGIDYALPKQDQVAIPPLDYAAGAMENWGLITYSELYMLYDPGSSTALTKQDVVDTVAHELAHQWTGNLVTIEWWSVIWLNEGFATYFQYFGADAAEPTFKESELFITNSLHYVFGIDSVPTSRPITLPVSSPGESIAMFDSISYDKGACLVRMMAHFMGAESFKRAMNLYLTRNAYQNVGQDDLFQALTDQASIDSVDLPASVKTIMDPWTYQMGYPIVNITRNYADGSATATQERFLTVPTNDTTVYGWWVPLSYRTLSNATPKFAWIPSTSQSISISDLGVSSNQWVLFNVDQAAYYRVVYDSINYGLICDQLVADHAQISVNNRAQLLDDAFTTAKLQMISYTDAMDLTIYLAKEQSYTPWHAVLPELDYLDSMFANSNVSSDWRRYMAGLVAPYYRHVGFVEQENDSHLTVLGRSDAIRWACHLQVSECAQDALTQFALWKNSSADAEVISRNQKAISLCAALANVDEADWQLAFERFLDPAFQSVRTALGDALGCTRIPALQTKLLEMMINRTEGVTTVDGMAFFLSLAENPTGNALAFNFMRDRFSDLFQDYSVFMPLLFRAVTLSYNTQEQLDAMIEIRDEHNAALGNAQAAIAGVTANIQWMNNNAPVISNWLQQHV